MLHEALSRQNVIMPSGDVKIGSKDYNVALNNSPSGIGEINSFPIKEINGRPVFVRDVAHVHDGYQVQTNAVTRNGSPGVLIVVRKSGGSSTLAVIDGTNSVLPELRNLLPAGAMAKFSYPCEDYGCARKGGLSPHSDENS